jgi:hypothetical protein
MQDRYAGDVGDFIKFGLLRALVAAEHPLRLGVNWYLTADQAHNADGKHVAYLDATRAHHRSLRVCDEELMARLAKVLEGTRSVAGLEATGVLPEGTVTFSEPLFKGMKPGERQDWQAQALAALAPADIVFVDPDNGIRPGRGGRLPYKFAFTEELADYSARRQSLVVYRHADRTCSVELQVPRRLTQLAAATGIEPLGAVVGRRGTCRFFFVLPAPAHRDRLFRALGEHQSIWSAHTDYLDFCPPGKL